MITNKKQSENTSDETGHENYPTASGLYDPSLLLEPKLGKPGEDCEQERAFEESLDSSPRRVRSDEWGEATEDGAEWATGVCYERAAPGSSAPEGVKETESRSRAPDEHPEALPPLLLDTGRVGGKEAPREAAQGASRGSPLLSHPSEGREEEEEEEAAGCMTSQEAHARGKVFGAGGRESEGREDLFRSA